MQNKDCTKCNKNLPYSEFNKDITSKDGFSYSCKQCRDNYTKQRRIKNKETKKEIPSEKICSSCKEKKTSNNFTNQATNKDGLNSYCKECVKIYRKKEKCPIIIDYSIKKICKKCYIEKQISEYRINRKSSDNFSHICLECTPKNTWTKEKQKESEKKYRLNNPEKFKEKYKRQSQNINRRIRNNLNKRIVEELFKIKNPKCKKTFEYIGCNVIFFKKWLEFQFTEGMNWQNYGLWHLDHVKPCHSFDLSDIEQVKNCFNWKNIQPLWANENIIKSNKIDENLIKKQKEKADNYEQNNLIIT